MDCEIGLQGDSSIILHGTNCTISDISVHDNGCGGIHMSGGDQVCCTYKYFFMMHITFTTTSLLYITN